ncbi:MAG: DUF4293 family protein [Flavobacteriaceae bacterium]|nr:DUF4293 family protein [Flavobacteriaceae bacterium]
MFKFAAEIEAMIQRVQSLYLLFVLALGLFSPLFFDRDIVDFTQDQSLFNDWFIKALFIIGSGLALLSVLKYRNRQTQFVLNRLNIIIQLLMLGVFVYLLLSLPGVSFLTEKGIVVFMPILSIVFLVMANKAILRDERLVKSADRLR